jgi:hypothetical protein
MKNKEIILRDYEWVLRVIESCKTLKHWEGAMTCYDLWIKKHYDDIDVHRMSLSRHLYSKLSIKIEQLVK